MNLLVVDASCSSTPLETTSTVNLLVDGFFLRYTVFDNFR